MLDFGKVQNRPDDVHSQHGFMFVAILAQVRRPVELLPHEGNFPASVDVPTPPGYAGLRRLCRRRETNVIPLT